MTSGCDMKNDIFKASVEVSCCLGKSPLEKNPCFPPIKLKADHKINPTVTAACAKKTTENLKSQ